MPAKKPSRSAKAGAPRKGTPAVPVTRARTGASAQKSPARGGSAPSRPAGAPAREARAAAPRPAAVDTKTRGGFGMGNVRPLRDRVMVRRLDEPEQKVGGIIIPDTAKEKPQQAEVVAVGSGRLLENGDRVPLSVKPGDKVLLGKWSGTDVKIDGEEYLILKEDEILGILG
jgi:chaperonin GroES